MGCFWRPAASPSCQRRHQTWQHHSTHEGGHPAEVCHWVKGTESTGGCRLRKLQSQNQWQIELAMFPGSSPVFHMLCDKPGDPEELGISELHHTRCDTTWPISNQHVVYISATHTKPSGVPQPPHTALTSQIMKITPQLAPSVYILTHTQCN